MKRTLRCVVSAAGVGLLALAVFATMVPDSAVAGKGGGKGGGGGDDDGCPRKGIFCTTEYDPVICDDGNTYSNACFAYVACATGCVPTGGGTQPL